MTTDNQKKYEEAAKARYPRWFQDFEEGIKMSAFLAGAYFVEKENEVFIQVLKKTLEEKDDQMALQYEIYKNAEKEAHNAAIDKAISIIMEKNHDYPIHHVHEELEKLKI